MIFVKADDRIAGVQINNPEFLFKNNQRHTDQRADLRCYETFCIAKCIAGFYVVGENREPLAQDALHYGSADFYRVAGIASMPSINRRKIFLTLSQQNRAAVNRYYLKNRVEDFAHQFRRVSQAVYSGGNLQQYAEIPSQSLLRWEPFCFMRLLQQFFRLKLLGGFSNQVYVIQKHQVAGARIFNLRGEKKKGDISDFQLIAMY